MDKKLEKLIKIAINMYDEGYNLDEILDTLEDMKEAENKC